MGNSGSMTSQDSGYFSTNSNSKMLPDYANAQVFKHSVTFAANAKRSTSVGESTWRKLVGRRKRSKVIPSQSMPENVSSRSNFPSKSQSNYKLEVDNHLLDQSAALFQKSCSVSGLSIINRNMEQSRLPNSKTSYNIHASHRSATAVPKKVTMTGSTSEMLRCLANFVNSRIDTYIEPNKLIIWLRNVDRQLLMQGWQDSIFMGPTALVIMFLLVRNDLPRRDPKLTSEDVRARLLTCLYITYSYAGPEISYPVKPFILSTELPGQFWTRCLNLSLLSSDQMLRLASDPQFFARCFRELKLYQDHVS